MTTTNTLPTPRLDRPLGIWILTLYAGLFYGIQPMLRALLGLFSRVGIFDAPIFINVLMSIAVFINFGTLFAAVGTWQGKRQSRNVLVALVLLLCLIYSSVTLFGLANNTALYAMLPEIGQPGQISAWLQVAKHVLISLVFLLYFFRQKSFFVDQPDALADGLGASLAALPENRNYFLLAGSLAVFMHWFLVVPAGGLAGALNSILTMPDALIASVLVLIFYPVPFAYFASSGPMMMEMIVAPVIGSFLWFLLGWMLAHHVKPLKRTLALCLGIKLVLSWLALVFIAFG